MIEKILVVTNNPMSEEKLCSRFTVEFIEGNVVEVMKSVRDYVHKGHRLLTHPLMSSIKPNETPYRTIILTKEGNNNIDFKSLSYIEESIASTEKFLNIYGVPNWSSSVLEDFKLIDYDLISHAID
jgi:hypothetical protein